MRARGHGHRTRQCVLDVGEVLPKGSRLHRRRERISAWRGKNSITLPGLDSEKAPGLRELHPTALQRRLMKNSDSCRLRERQLRSQERCFGGRVSCTAKLRVRVETPGPPELGKERFDEKVCIFVVRPHPSNRIGRFCFAAAEIKNADDHVQLKSV